MHKTTSFDLEISDTRDIFLKKIECTILSSVCIISSEYVLAKTYYFRNKPCLFGDFQETFLMTLHIIQIIPNSKLFRAKRMKSLSYHKNIV